MSGTHPSLRARWRVLPPVVRLLLLSMTGFNVGFSLVIPFLAVHMTDTLQLSASVVGLVLGLRVASQQGLFVVGGAACDRFGARPVVLGGIAVRVVGFVVLGLAADPVALVIGVLLVGVAAAFFAPAVESANASFGRELEAGGVLPRTELFGIEQIFSRTGTVVGPILGSVLLVVPFLWTALVAAVVFAALWFAFALLLPATLPGRPPARGMFRAGIAGVLTDRRFLVLAVLCSVTLAAQNVLYVLLPPSAPTETVGWYYVGAALFVVLGQRLLGRWGARLGLRTGLVLGLAVSGAAFVPPAVAVAVVPDAEVVPAAALAMWVVLLQVGQVLAVPPMREIVARLAGEHHLGVRFGMLSTVGGVMTLVASWTLGRVLDATGTAIAPLPWLVAGAAGVLAAVGVLAWWRPGVTAAVNAPRPGSP